MPRTRLDPPPGFGVPTADRVPVPRWHEEIVAERLAAHRADPAAALLAEAVFEDLARKLRDRRSR